jgi:PiT family inorganic phosphate transporter
MITPHLRPGGGFSAEVAVAITIELATLAKVPISTALAISGAGSGLGACVVGIVRWIWEKTRYLGVVLMFPAAGLIAAPSFFALRLVLEPHFRNAQLK